MFKVYLSVCVLTIKTQTFGPNRIHLLNSAYFFILPRVVWCQHFKTFQSSVNMIVPNPARPAPRCPTSASSLLPILPPSYYDFFLHQQMLEFILGRLLQLSFRPNGNLHSQFCRRIIQLDRNEVQRLVQHCMIFLDEPIKS